MKQFLNNYLIILANKGKKVFSTGNPRHKLPCDPTYDGLLSCTINMGNDSGQNLTTGFRFQETGTWQKT